MTENRERKEDLFVVRIWREPSSAKDPGWRGSSEHVESGTRMYFSNLADLTEFIQIRLSE